MSKKNVLRNRNQKMNKKGLVFIFFIFFLSLLIFATLNYNLFVKKYSKDNLFISSRVKYINDEFYYFKNNYLRNVISYSLYNTLFQIENFSRNSNYHLIDKNYSALNQLVLEGMLNGSFHGIKQDFLIGKTDGLNKTIKYFLKKYLESFKKDYKANLSVKIKKLNLFEKNPYYVSAQFVIKFDLTTFDNISEWHSTENYLISVPIYKLPIFEFYKYDGKLVRIRSSEYYLPQNDWNITYLKETLDETYTSHFIEKKHKYSIGSSFLKRLLNYSTGSYKGVLGFWSFDYDKIYSYKVYDTALYNNYSYHKGNSLIMYNFENNTLNLTNVFDISNNKIDGKLNNVLKDNRTGASGDSIKFPSKNSYIKIDRLNYNLSKFTISIWVKLNGSSDNKSYILDTNNNLINIQVDNKGFIYIYLNCTNSSKSYLPVKSYINISDDKWHNILFTYDSEGKFWLYIDGFTNFNEFSPEIHQFNGTLRTKLTEIILGNSISLNRSFNGNLDEFGFYKIVAPKTQISELTGKRGVFDIDYFNSLYGKALFFDGDDDFIDLGNNQIYNFNNKKHTIEIWFKIDNLSGLQNLIDKGDSSNGWGIFINDGYIEIGRHGSGTAKTNQKIINRTDLFYHLIIEGFDGTKPNLYLNGKEYSMSGSWPSSHPTTKNLTIGKSSYLNDYYFSGLIDEIRIFNRTLSNFEIESNYYNFNEFGKGCCNYIILMNYNKFGYNRSIYKKNISSSVKIFYDYYKKGLNYNLSLFNLSPITSYELENKYFNFLFDDCINYAYSISDYQTEDNSIRMGIYYIGNDNASCAKIISDGIY